MLAVGQLENCRLGLARRARLKPLKQLYNSTKTAPISESRTPGVGWLPESLIADGGGQTPAALPSAVAAGEHFLSLGEGCLEREVRGPGRAPAP